jgi:DNA (cytosine-5)-methyltransferase 1
MTAFLDLFSGIGGFALCAYRAGLRFDGHYFSEVDEYAIKVYQKHFPRAEPLGDIRNVDYAKLPGGEWLVTGGFPCQPHSVAGKRRGGEDERDLWPECRRMLRELRPSIALFENVRGLLTSPGRKRKGEFFNGVLSDISESGYDAEWQVISAADAGAPHLRKRVWIVAYPDNWNADDRKGKTKREICGGQNAFACGVCKNVSYADSQRREKQPDAITDGERNADGADSGNFPYAGQGQREFGRSNWWAAEPDVGRVAHGIPSRVDRLKGLGNAVVPQCAEMILRLPAFDLWRLAA